MWVKHFKADQNPVKQKQALVANLRQNAPLLPLCMERTLDDDFCIEFQIIKSNEAWNSPENSTDFPCCHFEVSHVDQGKKTFTCGVTVSHKQDSAEVEVTAVFEEPKKVHQSLYKAQNPY